MDNYIFIFNVSNQTGSVLAEKHVADVNGLNGIDMLGLSKLGWVRGDVGVCVCARLWSECAQQ